MESIHRSFLLLSNNDDDDNNNNEYTYSPPVRFALDNVPMEETASVPSSLPTLPPTIPSSSTSSSSFLSSSSSVINDGGNVLNFSSSSPLTGTANDIERGLFSSSNVVSSSFSSFSSLPSSPSSPIVPRLITSDPATTHRYLPPSEHEFVRMHGYFPANTILTIPLHLMLSGVSVFPGETIPLRIPLLTPEGRLLSRLVSSSLSSSSSVPSSPSSLPQQPSSSSLSRQNTAGIDSNNSSSLSSILTAPLLGAVAVRPVREARTTTTLLPAKWGTLLEIRTLHGGGISSRSPSSTQNDEFSSNPSRTLSLLATARQRFQVIELIMQESVPHARIRIADDNNEENNDELPYECRYNLTAYHPKVWSMFDNYALSNIVWKLALECNMIPKGAAKRAATSSSNTSITGSNDNSSSSFGESTVHPSPSTPWNVIAQDTASLSFWIARNLPISPKIKADLLEIPHTYSRLRAEARLLREFSVLACARCDSKIATKKDIVPMSEMGIMAVFVNPHGVVFRTLTARNIKPEAVSVTGNATLDSTWFEGYAWTFCNCRHCGLHLGWRYDWIPVESGLDLEKNRVRWNNRVEIPDDDIDETSMENDESTDERDTHSSDDDDETKDSRRLTKQSSGENAPRRTVLGGMVVTGPAADAYRKEHNESLQVSVNRNGNTRTNANTTVEPVTSLVSSVLPSLTSTDSLVTSNPTTIVPITTTRTNDPDVSRPMVHHSNVHFDDDVLIIDARESNRNVMVMSNAEDTTDMESETFHSTDDFLTNTENDEEGVENTSIDDTDTDGQLIMSDHTSDNSDETGIDEDDHEYHSFTGSESENDHEDDVTDNDGTTSEEDDDDRIMMGTTEQGWNNGTTPMDNNESLDNNNDDEEDDEENVDFIENDFEDEDELQALLANNFENPLPNTDLLRVALRMLQQAGRGGSSSSTNVQPIVPPPPPPPPPPVPLVRLVPPPVPGLPRYFYGFREEAIRRRIANQTDDLPSQPTV